MIQTISLDQIAQVQSMTADCDYVNFSRGMAKSQKYQNWRIERQPQGHIWQHSRQ
jgi:hypothetical protein